MSDALKELFLKALMNKELRAQYAVNEIQKQVKSFLNFLLNSNSTVF